MADVTYKMAKDFVRSLGDLWRKGGAYQRAAEQVQSVVGKISLKDPEPFRGMKMTKHGESRIPKCVKYDLSGYARLVSIHDENVVLLCFAGDHQAVDAWIDRNRGRALKADKDKLVEVFESDNLEDPESRITGQSKLTQGFLYERLPEDQYEALISGVTPRCIRELERLKTSESDEDIYRVVKNIQNIEQQTAVYDVFNLLLQDRVDQAIDRVRSFTKEVVPLSHLTEEEIIGLADTDKIVSIPADDPNFEKVFEYYVKNALYLDWMLYLHPDQLSHVNDDYPGSAKLDGVSGSGKTCVVVKRAIRLASKYPGQKILILTLNRSLASLIRKLVEAACPPGIEHSIEVLAFFELCQSLLEKYEPENQKIYDDKTWKSEEHIDEIWREYYRCELNNTDARVMHPVHDMLITRNIAAENYIKEEFDWIRSAVQGDRHEYLDLSRTGRSFPLQKAHRSLLLKGLSAWENKMRHVGVTDYLGIATAVHRYVDSLKPVYRCVLVDESQDFGTIELDVIRRLVSECDNDLFLCGDAAQQVSAKHQNFASANINIPSTRRYSIRKNYRNSREILAAAYEILVDNISEEMEGENFTILDPEFASFSGPPPLMLRANSLEEELAYALAFVEAEIEARPGAKGCLAVCGYSLYELEVYARRLGLRLLDGSVLMDEGNLFISDLEQTKGFEFDIVCIVNCNGSAIPDPMTPSREQFRDLARFYVAMTRAKNQLVLSFSGEASPLLARADKHFLTDEWLDYMAGTTVELAGMPPRLEAIRYQDVDTQKPIGLMTGEEFLYSRRPPVIE